MGFFARLFARSDQRRDDGFAKLEKRIGYRFQRIEYLIQAFTHRSLDPGPRQNYERLEFLGDAVIDLVISEALMSEFPEGDEGILTQKRSALVQKSFLSVMGNMLDLLSILKIEASVDLDIDKIAVKQLGNVYEALIGAMYMDGGIDPCEKLILDTVWRHRVEAWKATNYKGRLIEFCHSSQQGNPKFCVASVTGPEHQKMFEIHVKIGDREFPTGIGSNKKAAEQSAAQIALDALLDEL
ncbi:MAG: ribonuclease III [Candidatus Neomarinimicrobiota bacterium]